MTVISIDPSHEAEFMTFRRMGHVQAMVYVSGYLNDMCEMVRGGYNRDQVLAHLVDAREMLGILTKDWAVEKGYRIDGNVIYTDDGRRLEG